MNNRQTCLLAAMCALWGCSSAPKTTAELPPQTTSPITEASPTTTETPHASTPERLQAGGCQVDQGCPPLTPIPTCDPSISAQTIDVVTANPKAWHNKTLAIVGPLNAMVMCTERGCDRECCNSCSGGVVIGKGGFNNRETVYLTHTQMPQAFQCHGDETLSCCPYEANTQEVIATGTFKFITERTVEVMSVSRDDPTPKIAHTYKEAVHELVLEDPKLCIP